MRINAELKEQNNVIKFEPIGWTPKLEIGKKYSLDIKSYKSNRSLEQNALMWKLIQSISKATSNDEMDVYISGLEHCEVKSDLIVGLPETEQSLRKAFRAVKVMGKSFIGLQEALIFKVYFGSSKFNVSEMNKLIEYFEGLANELEIER